LLPARINFPPLPGAFHGFEIAGADIAVVRNFRDNYFTALRNALCLD